MIITLEEVAESFDSSQVFDVLILDFKYLIE